MRISCPDCDKSSVTIEGLKNTADDKGVAGVSLEFRCGTCALEWERTVESINESPEWMKYRATERVLERGPMLKETQFFFVIVDFTSSGRGIDVYDSFTSGIAAIRSLPGWDCIVRVLDKRTGEAVFSFQSNGSSKFPGPESLPQTEAVTARALLSTTPIPVDSIKVKK